MAAFCQTTRDQPDTKKIHYHILDYVIHLLDETQDCSWSAGMASDAVLLVIWNKGRFMDGWTLTLARLIGPVFFMHREKLPHMQIKVKKVKISLIFISTILHVCRKNRRKQEGCFTGICSDCCSSSFSGGLSKIKKNE